MKRTEQLTSRLFSARVMHARMRPFFHKFTYRVFTGYFDIDELPKASGQLKFFSYNRFNLFSIRTSDLGARDGSDIRHWVENLLNERAVELDNGPIRILTFPRILGYAFNPLSIYFCHHGSGELKAIIYAVSNTFGEHHNYVVPIDAEDSIRQHNGSDTLYCHERNKLMHVSPFIDMTPLYRFKVRVPNQRLSIMIKENDKDGELLIATMNGDAKPLNDYQLVMEFIKMPFMMIKVITTIHWEALRLWLKGAVFHRSPEPPKQDYSF